MAKIGEDNFEMKEQAHEREHEEEQRDEETLFIRDDGFKNDFERLRNDFNRFPGEYNFNLDHEGKGKDGYIITFPDLEDADNTFDLEEERKEIR